MELSGCIKEGEYRVKRAKRMQLIFSSMLLVSNVFPAVVHAVETETNLFDQATQGITDSTKSIPVVESPSFEDVIEGPNESNSIADEIEIIEIEDQFSESSNSEENVSDQDNNAQEEKDESALSTETSELTESSSLPEESVGTRNLIEVELATGTWGEVSWSYREVMTTAGVVVEGRVILLTSVGAVLGTRGEAPWNNGTLNRSRITYIGALGTFAIFPRSSVALFSELPNLISVSGIRVNQRTDLTGLFENCPNLQSVLIVGSSDFVIQTADMFKGCTRLSQVDLIGFPMPGLRMFEGTSINRLELAANNRLSSAMSLPEGIWSGPIEGLYLSTEEFVNSYDGSNPGIYVRNQVKYWGTSPYFFNRETGKLIVYPGTLAGGAAGTPWQLGDMLQSDVTEIEFIGEVILSSESTALLSGLSQLKNIVGEVNVSRVENYSLLFSGNSELIELDLSNWNIGAGVLFQQMFGSVNMNSLNLSSWDFNTSNNANVESMFMNSYIKELDISGWDSANIYNMEKMFSNSTIDSIVLGEKSILTMDSDLTEGNWTGKNTGVFYPTTEEFLTYYDGSQPDIFIRNQAKYWGTSRYLFDGTTGTLTVYEGTIDTQSPWILGDLTYEEIKKIYFDGPIVVEDGKSLFEGLTNVVEIRLNEATFIESSLANMFKDAKSLQSIDVSGWDVSNIKMMNGMFLNCESLISIDLSDWQWSQVTNMDTMFYGCKNLKNIDVSSLTRAPVSSNSMFEGCTSLESIDFSNVNSDNFMRYSDRIFKDCVMLKTVKLGSFLAREHNSGVFYFENAKNIEYIEINQYELFDLPESDFGWFEINSGKQASGTVSSGGFPQPAIFVWDRINSLNIESKENNNVSVGEKFDIQWALNIEDAFDIRESIENLTLQVTTKEDIEFSEMVEIVKINDVGEAVSTEEIELIEESSDTFRIEIPKLEYAYNYLITLSGEAWNNSLSDVENNFKINADYDAHILIDSDTKATALIDGQSNSYGTLIIGNGNLFFGGAIEPLHFNTTKLSTDLNGKLVTKVDNDWEISINDYRGTNQVSSVDSSVSRKMWELVATADDFKDSNNNELPENTLGIVYVDENNNQYDLGSAETILVRNDTAGETPKENHTHQLSWDKEHGLHVIVRNRNNLKTEEPYSANVTFDLRSAP